MACRFTADNSNMTRTAGLPNATNFSCCGWLQLSSNLGREACILNIATATPANFLVFTASDGVTLQVSDNSAIAVGATVLLVGRWYFFAATKAGALFTIYVSPVNGGPLGAGASGTSAVTYTGNWATFRLGREEFTPTTFVDGNLANFKMWGAALTREELAAEQFSGLPARTLNLDAWYPLNSALTAPIDFSGNSHNLTAGSTVLRTEAGPPCGWF